MVRIASVVMQCDQNHEVNTEKMTKIIQDVKNEHADIDLVFFGETIDTWYNPVKAKDLHFYAAQCIPGRRTQHFAKLAKELGIYICFGMNEKNGDVLQNSQVLINPDGDIQAIHRKHTFREQFYQAGTDLITMTEISGLEVALVICSDISDLNTIYKLIRQKPDLILLSLADDKDEDYFISRLNALIYKTWIVEANRYGQEIDFFWDGHQAISDPFGNIVQKSMGSENIMFCEIHKTKTDLLTRFYLWLRLLFSVLKNQKKIRTYL